MVSPEPLGGTGRGKLGPVRIAVAALSMSAAGFAAWTHSEGFTDHAVIPTKGDVPTIGHGSTRYEDGTRVKMGDRMTRQRADELAKNLRHADDKKFAATLPGVKLTQGEFDVYTDYVGQYGINNWAKSSMRRELLAGRYVAACQALLKYRFAAGYDCSTPGNKRCWGSWVRQRARYKQCMSEQ